MQRSHNDRRRSGSISSSFGDSSGLRRSPSTTLLRQSQPTVATITTNAHADSVLLSRVARANSFSASPIPIDTPSAGELADHRRRRDAARLRETMQYARDTGNVELGRQARAGGCFYYEDAEEHVDSSADSDRSFTIPVRDARPLLTSPGRRPRLDFSDLARTHEERERPRDYGPQYPALRPSTVRAMSPSRNAPSQRGAGPAPSGGALRRTIGFDIPGAPPPRPPSPSRNPLGGGSYGPYASRGGGWGGGGGTSAMRSLAGRAVSPGRTTGGMSQVGRPASPVGRGMGSFSPSRPLGSLESPPAGSFRGGRSEGRN